jgi:hypothetical protein
VLERIQNCKGGMDAKETKNYAKEILKERGFMMEYLEEEGN